MLAYLRYTRWFDRKKWRKQTIIDAKQLIRERILDLLKNRNPTRSEFALAAELVILHIKHRKADHPDEHLYQELAFWVFQRSGDRVLQDLMHIYFGFTLEDIQPIEPELELQRMCKVFEFRR